MINKLPEWYRITRINANAELLENRSNAILEYIKTAKVESLFNCIRLYLYKEIKDDQFINNFFNFFLSKDPLFPQSENTLELRTLAGAILSEFIDTKKSKERIFIAMALKSSSFQIVNGNVINPDIIQDFENFIQNESINNRNFEEKVPILSLNLKISPADNTIENISQAFGIVNENFKNLNEVFKYLIKKNLALEEESNIHWWLFRGYSKYGNKPTKELKPQSSPILVARELSELTVITPGPVSAKQFLKKMLNEISTGNNVMTTIKEVINSLDINIKEELIQQYKSSSLFNICPIMLGITKSLEINDERSWIPFFEKETGIKPDVKIEMVDLAHQFYLENIIVKSIL
jgi:hypothetical protein